MARQGLTMSVPIPPYILRQQTRRILLPLAVILALIVAGTIGYMALEGWSLGDALYMTIITLSTVGFGEVRPLSGAGRAFTGALILSGVGTLAYGLTLITRSIVEGEINGRFVRQQIERRIHDLHGHVIVCGYGRVGQSLATELREDGIPLLVVEHEADRFSQCLDSHFLGVLGDATRDDVLLAAGILRARGLAIALDDDAKNVFIALTGRALNPNVYIVSRCGLPESAPKLLHAGANRVVSPYTISGHRMAALITRPNVVDIVEIAMRRGGIEYALDEFVLASSSPFVGRSLAELALRETTGAVILAVIDVKGQIMPKPSATYRLQGGDTLVAVGTHEELSQLEQLAGTERART